MPKKTKINLVYSTHLKPEENLKFEEHIIETSGVNTTIYKYNNFNEYSLTEVYNKAINVLSERKSEDEITVFAHNDIIFDTKDWGRKLLKHFNNSKDYQIIGVAGSKSMNLNGCWWLDENNKMNSKDMIGIVNHFNGLRKWTSKYSETFYGVKPVVIVDGLFMAVDLNKIVHKFDESYKGFHFYDISFCFPNYLDGCNIGVITDIRITHKSIGQTNDEWEKNRIQFVKEYEEYLPITVE